MPKGKGYGTKRSKWEDGDIGVNQNYSTPHQKTITIEKRSKALGMGKVGVIGITSMGNTSKGTKSSKMEY